MTNAIAAAKGVRNALQAALHDATVAWDGPGVYEPKLSKDLVEALRFMHARSESASTAFTNVLTGMAIKAAFPAIDVRYHQEQIQDRVSNGAGFSFRTISENVVYPWLNGEGLDGAKSGWQTRTYERDDPYTLNYPHKIGGSNPSLRENFLQIYHEIEDGGQDAREALRYILFLQVEKRHNSSVNYANPRTDNIDRIVDIFTRHFNHPYQGKGASRLPVLAIYAIYKIIVGELKRYDQSALRPLGAHSAADSRTGSVGDIEVETAPGKLLEALEIKHNIKIDAKILASAESKIKFADVKRYYILTTHADCGIGKASSEIVAHIANVYDCTVIANGVYATLRYYLRLIKQPHDIFAIYTALLDGDAAIGHEHRVAWNTVVAQT